MAQITVELDNDALLEALEETTFSEPEKMRILKLLFPHRGYTDKMRLVREISVFINDNM